MKLELGGGLRARGDGWINIDQVPEADIRHDLNVIPWPLDDDTVDDLYTSHCLEHLEFPYSIFNEICRVCRVGAKVEIRVPHPSSDLAMCAGHAHVYSPVQAINTEHHFPREFWTQPKRMKLDSIGYGATFLLEEAKLELPFLAGVSDETIMKFIPRTCHECRFFYTVVHNEFLVD